AIPISGQQPIIAFVIGSSRGDFRIDGINQHPGQHSDRGDYKEGDNRENVRSLDMRNVLPKLTLQTTPTIETTESTPCIAYMDQDLRSRICNPIHTSDFHMYLSHSRGRNFYP